MPAAFRGSESERAKRQGRRSGYDPIEQTASCPYLFDQFQLRRQWLAGFSEGRGSYQEELRLQAACVL